MKIKVNLSQPRNSQKPAERAGTEPSLGPSEGAQPCQHLDLELLASRTVRQYISAVEATQSVVPANGYRLPFLSCLPTVSPPTPHCRVRDLSYTLAPLVPRLKTIQRPPPLPLFANYITVSLAGFTGLT